MRRMETETAGWTHLLAAVESLTFLPSNEAKCCSRASRRLLGACCDRKHSVSKFPKCWKRSVCGHQAHKGSVVGNKDGERRKQDMPWKKPLNPGVNCARTSLIGRINFAPQKADLNASVTHHWFMTAFRPNRSYSRWEKHLWGMVFCTTALSTTGTLLNWPRLSTAGQNELHLVHTSTTWPKWTGFTTASVFSFNCFSPRCRRQSQSRGMQKDNTEASHGHRRRVKW